MEEEKPLPKPRRMRGTPAQKFSTRVALAVTAFAMGTVGILELVAGDWIDRKLAEGHFRYSSEAQDMAHVMSHRFFQTPNRASTIQKEFVEGLEPGSAWRNSDGFER